VGILEKMLVQEIVACWWRGPRIIRAENGAIASENSLLSERFLLPDDGEAYNILSESKGNERVITCRFLRRRMLPEAGNVFLTETKPISTFSSELIGFKPRIPESLPVPACAYLNSFLFKHSF